MARPKSNQPTKKELDMRRRIDEAVTDMMRQGMKTFSIEINRYFEIEVIGLNEAGTSKRTLIISRVLQSRKLKGDHAYHEIRVRAKEVVFEWQKAMHAYLEEQPR